MLLLLWAAEASAGSRISLLPFEGDRPKPVRWRVAYALKRAGHVVLGYAPPADRSSVGSLRDYADQRNVDLFVSGTATETEQGWQLTLRFRGANGKAVGQPVMFRADSLKGLLAELKLEGPSTFERALPGGSGAAVAELPPGRALPLPTRRASPRKPKSDRPVLPGATAPEEDAPASDEESASEARPTQKKVVDLDQMAASAGAGATWDADAPDGPARGSPSTRSAGGRTRAKDGTIARRIAARGPATRGTATRGPATRGPATRGTGRGAAARLAGSSGLFASTAPSQRSEALDLDADTRNALEEAPKSKSKGKTRAAPEEADPNPASDPLDDPATKSEVAAASALSEAADSEVIDADALEDSPTPAPEPQAKPKKKGGLFAGRWPRKSSSGDASEGSSETTVEDRDTSSSGSSLRTPPHAAVGARVGFLHRSLAYSDDLYNRLRAPTTNGWTYKLEANLYPFARPLKERFSLIASYEGALAGTVRDNRTNQEYGVTFSELAGGARVRFPLGQHELGMQATFGRISAGLDASAGVTGIPEIRYVAVRPAADLTLNFGPVSLRGGLGYQRALGGFGEMATADWFPHMDGYGFEGQLGLDYRVSQSVTLQASGSLRRFVLDMNSRPEDAIGGTAEVAGGAVDQYTAGYFGVTFAL